jgi:hypothetical protein
LAAGIIGTGQLRGKQIHLQPRFEDTKYTDMLSFVSDDDINLENVYLQWLYKFQFVEGLCAHLQRTPDSPADWNPTHKKLIRDGLHFMTVMAALMYLFEESPAGRMRLPGSLPPIITREDLNSQRMHDVIVNKIKELTVTLFSKTADYGQSFNRHGIIGLIPRLWDKIARYTMLSSKGFDINHESKEDSVRDLLGYCLIAWSLTLEI